MPHRRAVVIIVGLVIGLSWLLVDGGVLRGPGQSDSNELNVSRALAATFPSRVFVPIAVRSVNLEGSSPTVGPTNTAIPIATATPGINSTATPVATTAASSTAAPQSTVTMTSTPSPTVTTVPGSLAFRNGNFDQGAGVGWTQSGAHTIIVDPTKYNFEKFTLQPLSASHVAWLGGFGSANTFLSQTFTLPAGSPAYLHIYTFVYSEELCDVFYYDSITLTANGTKLYEDARLCQGKGTNGWVYLGYVDLSGAAGLQVRLEWEFYGSDGAQTYVFLDNLTLTTTTTRPN